MATIRKAEKKDIKDIEYICRMTAGPVCQREPITGNRVAKIYSTYYATECTDSCFVLADESDKAVGYVLCEPDWKRYSRLYREKYVPQIFALKKRDGFVAWFFPVPYMVFSPRYPAHLHIDILPEFQGQGYGTKMLEKLFEELRGKGIKGVMLMAGGENEGAIRLYKRMGFEMLLHTKHAAVMGKKL